VRAQWAARPFVWHVYPTPDHAHWIKLAAFLRRYEEGLAPAHASAVEALWTAWNQRESSPSPDGARPALPEAWADFVARRAPLLEHARGWSDSLSARPDLASALVDFDARVLAERDSKVLK